MIEIDVTGLIGTIASLVGVVVAALLGALFGYGCLLAGFPLWKSICVAVIAAVPCTVGIQFVWAILGGYG